MQDYFVGELILELFADINFSENFKVRIIKKLTNK